MSFGELPSYQVKCHIHTPVRYRQAFLRVVSKFDRFLETTRDRSVLAYTDSCNGFDPVKGLHDGRVLEQEPMESKAFVVFNEELLSLPVKQFIAESVQHFIIGLPSHSLKQLILLFLNLLNPNFSKDAKDSKKISTSTDDLCKKVIFDPNSFLLQASLCKHLINKVLLKVSFFKKS